jgi:hypothetical protein
MGTWFDTDGLLRKFGVTKAVPNLAGEFQTLGALREVEVKIDISTLTTTASIISDQVFWPKGMFLEEVQVEVQTAVATITSFSVGLIQDNDRTTSISDTTFVNAVATATVNAAGNKLTLVTGSTGAGTGIGTAPIAAGAAFTGMLSAKIAGSAGTGIVIVRARYRAVL